MSQQINLLGSAPQTRRPPVGPTAIAAGLAVALVLIAAYSWHEQRRLRALQTEVVAAARAVQAEQAAHAKRTAAVQPAQPDAALEAEIARLERELSARQDVVDALESGSVGTTSGFSVYMRAFSRQSMEGVWLAGFDISAGGQELTLKGRALSADLVPRYLQRLHQEPSLQGRRFASLLLNQGKSADSKSAKTATRAERAKGPGGAASQEPDLIEFEVSSRERSETDVTVRAAASPREPNAVAGLVSAIGAGAAARRAPEEAAK